MKRQGSLASGVSLATLAAGPVFLACLAFGWFWSQVPKPVVIDGGAALVSLPVALFAATVVGTIASILPNLVGAMVMAGLADRLPPLRSGVAWALAGALLPCAIWFAFVGAAGVWLLPFATTGAICAALCRRSVRWHAEPAGRVGAD